MKFNLFVKVSIETGTLFTAGLAKTTQYEPDDEEAHKSCEHEYRVSGEFKPIDFSDRKPLLYQSIHPIVYYYIECIDFFRSQF